MMREPRRFEREFVSAECDSNDHDSCSHLSGVGGGLGLFIPGSGVRPLLCHCACHASCGLSTDQHHTVDEWFDLCSCPGAEPARERTGRPPNLAELIRKGRDDVNLRREASAEARANSMGKSREEIREILIAALHARGLQPPPQPVVELELDNIMMNRGVIGRVHMAARGITTLAGLGSEIIKAIRRHPQSDDPKLTLAKDPILVDADRSLPTIEVKVDPDAQYLLDPTGGHEGFEHTDESVIFVRLEGVLPPIVGALIAIYFGDHRVGVLSLTHSAAYQALLEASTRSNRPLVAEAIRRRGADGTWRLYLYRPRA
jgi:hypothetical protein